MNEAPMYIAAGIGGLMILLGFFALLGQRIYLDSQTLSPIEIDLPIIGKMKANYPALVFVFLGSALTVYGVQQQLQQQAIERKNPKKVEWQVEGTLTASQAGIDWQKGCLEISPGFHPNLDPRTGKFTILALIDEGKTVEDEIKWISYTHPNGSVKLFPSEELNRFKANKQTLLTGVHENLRSYKAPIELFPPLENSAP
jgi:hypothetical protein